MSSVQGGTTAMVAAKRRGVQSRSKDDVIERLILSMGVYSNCVVVLVVVDDEKMDDSPDVLDYYVSKGVESINHLLHVLLNMRAALLQIAVATRQ